MNIGPPQLSIFRRPCKLYNISGRLYYDNPFTSAANTQIRHVFCFGAYPRAQRPDILNGAQWTQLSPSSEQLPNLCRA